MDIAFNELVDKILELSIDEKQEIKNILDHSLIGQRRDEIYKRYVESKEQEKSDKLKFSDSISDLKKQL